MRNRRKLPDGVEGASVALVADAHYHSVVRHLAGISTSRFLANIFIVDPTPARDPDLNVDSLLIELRCAAQRGVDVRLLIGGSRTNPLISEVTVMAQWRSQQLGLSSRLVSLLPNTSSHVKMVVADDYVLSGSHNWSGGAFSSLQVQDSILIVSPDAASYLATRFEKNWRAAVRDNRHV